MKPRTIICWLTVALLATGLPLSVEAKSYTGGGGHSYSSHSSGGSSHSFSSGSHSFSSGGSHSSSSSSGSSHSSSSGSSHSSGSSGGSKSFSSGAGKSYGSGSSSSDTGRKSYSSGKSYSAGSGREYKSLSSSPAPISSSAKAARKEEGSSGFSFDTAAARARQEEASRAELKRFRDSQAPPPVPRTDTPRPTGSAPGYSGTPPPIAAPSRPSSWNYYPDTIVVRTRRARFYDVFNPYVSRPVVVYHDPYSSFFWWWLLDRSLDDRAWWAYHHRYDMDPARYQALLAQDQQLDARVAALETQQAPRDPAYTPPGLDRDLMYTDHYVAHAYSNRPTLAGAVAFWALGVPTALAVCALFIWLVWFKRWQPAT